MGQGTRSAHGNSRVTSDSPPPTTAPCGRGQGARRDSAQSGSREKPAERPQRGGSGERCAFPPSKAGADKKGSTYFLPRGVRGSGGGRGFGGMAYA